jgi:hypothetical protein
MRFAISTAKRGARLITISENSFFDAMKQPSSYAFLKRAVERPAFSCGARFSIQPEGT